MLRDSRLGFAELVGAGANPWWTTSTESVHSSHPDPKWTRRVSQSVYLSTLIFVSSYAYIPLHL
jgi:hypothetical protein